MNTKNLLNLFASLFLLTQVSCGQPPISTTLAPASTPSPGANLPNPASVYCEQQGNKLEIRTASDGSQNGVCIFAGGSECDEWAYYRKQCGPAMPGSSTPGVAAEPTSVVPTEIPTPIPIDPSQYQGWWTYTHPVYAFSIKLPEDWVVDETTTFDPLMNGHALNLHSRIGTGIDLNIRMTFRRIEDDFRLWPTGVGSGEFVPQGTIDVAGQPARRVLFICPAGQVNAVWYHGVGDTETNILRGDLEFGFIASFNGMYCQEGFSLGGKILHMGDMVVASLKVP